MSSASRLQALVVCFLVAVAVVIVHLGIVMLGNHEAWAKEGQVNRWAFRMVPSKRGALLDRDGRVLAHDQPTLLVTLYYKRFRLYHAVGAAVHGATTFARLHPGCEALCYEYTEGPLGPTAACRDLLAMPTEALRRGVLEKEVANVLATAVTTVLSEATGMARREVFRHLREHATSAPHTPCGDVLPEWSRDRILASYARILADLLAVDHILATDLHKGEDAAQLVPRLERLRIASLTQEKSSEKPDAPLREEQSITLANHVPFEVGAPLRIGDRQPGIDVQPSVARITVEPAGTMLCALVGETRLIGRSDGPDRTVEKRLEPDLPQDWLDEFVPLEAMDSDAQRVAMQEKAGKDIVAMTKRSERWGRNGAEAAYDDELSGRIGMRLVERDSRQREHAMWGQLQVLSGADVTLTYDTALQHLAQDVVREAWLAGQAQYEEEKDRARADVALAVIDAGTGDVLALAGEPTAERDLLYLPGVGWNGNAELGSLVKPFVLVEQLESEIAGRPHVDLATVAACNGARMPFGGTKLKGCEGEAHWDQGRDPVMALALSCNSFFYQLAVGLGVDSVNRSLCRFGLLEAAADTVFAPCWQAKVEGFRWVPPRSDMKQLLPRRAIGYGLQATPLAVARAYAGLATGRLPTLGTRIGSGRPVLDLGLDASVLNTVRAGLEACVQRGTARRVKALADFDVLGKTGTAEVGTVHHQNNASFAGYLRAPGAAGVQLAFCAVLYWVPDATHGADAAGGLIARFLQAVAADPELAAKYLPTREGK